MPKPQGGQGFAGHMQQILQILAVAEIEPDAPQGAVQQIRQGIIGMMQGGQQQPGMQGGGMPVQPGLQSRGPTPGMDTGPMAGDIASMLSQGQGQQQGQPQPGQPGMPPQ